MNSKFTPDNVLELLTEGKFDEVISICESIDTKDAQLLEYYAMAECHQGNLDRSKEIFTKAIQVDPQYKSTLQLLRGFE